MDSIEEGLEGKVAIVTGAGSRPGEGVGNGRAAAILLARAGARVVLADAVIGWAEDTRRMIEAEGGEAIIVEADVTKPADCQAIVEAATGRWGRLDALVNNVGISGPKGTAEDVDPEEWAQGLLVNVTSMMLMAKYAVPAMRAAGGGAIVNIGSVAGLKGGHPVAALPDQQGRGGEHDPRHGGAPCQGRHPGELRLPGHGLHADGAGQRHDPGEARGAPQAQHPAGRRQRLGHRRRGGVPVRRQRALDDRGDRAGGCRGDGDRGAAGGRRVKAGEKVFSPRPHFYFCGLALAARRHPDSQK